MPRPLSRPVLTALLLALVATVLGGPATAQADTPPAVFSANQAVVPNGGAVTITETWTNTRSSTVTFLWLGIHPAAPHHTTWTLVSCSNCGRWGDNDATAGGSSSIPPGGTVTIAATYRTGDTGQGVDAFDGYSYSESADGNLSTLVPAAVSVTVAAS
ncbi:hypothetical protein [Kutzneria albida]|uniref:Secreted protein n=1 Tax=Kutzneria albida DSM 43870 TaxID=1449976 RepID=W5WAJ8_9PSEU|nr:hypothetical protein [Kutzneria albida]AHH97775.1 hypothetical protein KALB_4413 [Kutzneria albida DSM 43870]